MPTQIIEIEASSGETLITVGIYPKGSDTFVVGTDGLALTEIPGKPQHYRLSTTAGISGWHNVIVEDEFGDPFGTWWVNLTNADAVHYSTPDLSGTKIGGITGTIETLDALWTKIKKWLQLAFRKDVAVATDNATELAEINANGGSGGGTFKNTTDSLEAIRDRLAVPGVHMPGVVDGTTLTFLRGDTIRFSVTGLGDISARTKLWLTGKQNTGHADSNATFKIEETAGLEVLSGAEPGTGETASITVTDENAGDIDVEISAAAASRWHSFIKGKYDFQVLTASGVITLLTGVLNISADVTRDTD